MTCEVEHCYEEAICKGLCRKHYDSLRHNGVVELDERSRVCPVCGGWFPLERSTRLFCSPVCRVRFFRAKRKGKAPRMVVREPKTRKRSISSAVNVRVALFTDMDVWESNDGVCIECLQPVDPHASLLSPDGMASAWLVPLDAGGTATLDNRVLLHVGCMGKWMERGMRGRNWKKGKRRHR